MGYHSFLVAPDGSKEDWDESTRGDSSRERFIEWLRADGYEGDRYLHWVEVQYGDDLLATCVVRSSDGDDMKRDEEDDGSNPVGEVIG